MEEAIVGRAAEVGRVVAFLSESAAGPRALLLHGEAGIGKTTVWREAVHRARELGRRVLFARPGQSESELPYSALADLLDGIGDEVIAGLPAPQRVAVEAAFARGDSTAAPDGHALARGVLGLLRTTGANARVLLAIDDAQWLDRPSASVLTFALRRVERVPLRVLVAVRSSHGSQLEPPLELARWQSNVTYVEVGPLSPTELGAVVARHLGIALPRPRVEELARVSGGNPTFAVELARREEAVRARPDPPTLGQALSARLEALEPEAWDAVVVASAALQPSTDLLLRAGVDAAGIDASVRAGIFALDSGRISFTHPLLGSGAYELLPTDERRTVHERLAGASDSALERGHHLSRASVAPDRSTAEALAAAGCEAAELGDHTGAAAFFLRAAELSVDPAGEEAGRRRVRATLELETAGDIDAAARLARELTTTLPAGLLRAQARRTLVSCEIGTALTFGEGLEELSLALADARDDDGIAASIHVAMADVMTTGWRFSESLEHLQAAIELAERAGDTATAVAALSDKGFVESLLGYGISSSSLRAFELWDGAILSPNTYSPRLRLGCVRLHAAQFEEAARLFGEELAMAEERGLEAIEVLARFHLAEVQTRAGDWAAALANSRLAAEHARQATHAQSSSASTYALAAVEALLGNHAAARSLSSEGLSRAESIRDPWYATLHRAVLAFVALAEDDAPSAIELLEPAWATMRERGIGNPSIFPVAHVLGEALAATGRDEETLAVARELRALPGAVHPWSRAMASRCEALVASSGGDHHTARAAIDEALAAHTHLSEPFELARTLHIQGRIERRARSWAGARKALESALVRFDTLGAARWAENTATDFARLPGRRPTADGELTATERRVAALVAEGLSNKEAAARLFVSVRAVEANLSRIYAKLGIRSRAGLAARLRRSAG